MKKNKLYTTEEYFQGKLSDNKELLKSSSTISLHLQEAESLEKILLNNIADYSHKCISVYRDSFEVNSIIYNICLSCGDFYKDDERLFLTSKGIREFKKFKAILKMSIRYED